MADGKRQRPKVHADLAGFPWGLTSLCCRCYCWSASTSVERRQRSLLTLPNQRVCVTCVFLLAFVSPFSGWSGVDTEKQKNLGNSGNSSDSPRANQEEQLMLLMGPPIRLARRPMKVLLLGSIIAVVASQVSVNAVK